MSNYNAASSSRGYAQPGSDPQTQAELERRARRQAEAIDAEYEIVGEKVPNLPAKVPA